MLCIESKPLVFHCGVDSIFMKEYPEEKIKIRLLLFPERKKLSIMCSYVTDTEGTETVRSLDYAKILRRSVQEWKRVTFSQTD